MSDRTIAVFKWAHRAILSVRSRYFRTIAVLTLGSYEKPLTVNGPTRFTRRTALGSNTNFNGLTIAGSGSVRIGDNFHSGPECLIITSFHDYDNGNAIPYGRESVDRSVVIGDNVWLGSRVTIVGGNTLGEGCIVQAGAVVVNDVPDFAIVGGNPAKVFKYRDREHYAKLKAAGRFL